MRTECSMEPSRSLRVRLQLDEGARRLAPLASAWRPPPRRNGRVPVEHIFDLERR